MKNIHLLLLFLMLSLGSFAQETVANKDTTTVYQVRREVPKEQKEQKRPQGNNEPLANKFYYGGYLNLTFGSYTALGIEPLIAYKIDPKLSVGTMVTYEYVSDKTHPGYNYSASNYGASLFGRFRVIPQIYFHTEFSEMYYESYKTGGFSSRYWVPFLFVGGGFSQQISENTWFNTQLLFDVIQNQNSPYKSWVPFYSVGFGVGF